MRDPDNLDMQAQFESDQDAYLASQERQMYERFTAGQFCADFIVTALQNIGTDKDFDVCEACDNEAFSRFVDIEADDNMILTHYLIFSREFREHIFDYIKDEFYNYVRAGY